MSGSIYLDTNIFIALFEGERSFNNALWEFINLGVGADGVKFCTSSLSFSELLVRPYRERDEPLAQLYLQLAKSDDWLHVHHVEPSVIDMAAAIRAFRKMRLPDAIHLATASKFFCGHMLTFDTGIASLPEIRHPMSGKLVGQPVEIIHPDPASLAALLEPAP